MSLLSSAVETIRLESDYERFLDFHISRILELLALDQAPDTYHDTAGSGLI